MFMIILSAFNIHIIFIIQLCCVDVILLFFILVFLLIYIEHLLFLDLLMSIYTYISARDASATSYK